MNEEAISRRRKRAAVSEILGAVILLFITVGAFALIASGIFTSTQNQQASVIQAYAAGEIKSGQLASLIYHWESSSGDTVKVGLYDYGFYNITLKMVFINGTQQFLWSLADAPQGNNEKCSCLITGQVEVLTVSGISGNAQNAVKAGNYELFLYATDSLAYVWEL